MPNQITENHSGRPSIEALELRYIPELDGLRAIAIIIVIASHYGLGRIIPGNFGVTLFFFISGFLITSLLFKELNDTGTLAIKLFYIRRFLRLAPALLVMIALTSAGYFALTSTIVWPAVAAGLLYYTNYYGIFGGSSAMPITPLWSLSVEEHFYLFYPAFFYFFARNSQRFLSYIIVSLCCILIWRYILVYQFHASENYTHISTDTRLDSILYGAVLALLIQTRSWLIPFLGTHAALIVGLLLLCLSFAIRENEFRETARYSTQGLALIPIVYWCLYTKTAPMLRAALSALPMTFTGKISYSLYLWHLSALYFAESAAAAVHIPEIWRAAIALAGTIAAATLSYLLVEKPVQQLRQAFRASSSHQAMPRTAAQ